MNKPFAKYPLGARRLMLTAERLFGEMGVEGVSIRQLLIAAGQANKSAVQHYFGSTEGLVQAVRDMRLTELDNARQRRLASLSADGANRDRELVAALFLPILEIMDDENLESYSQFSLRLLHADISDQTFLQRLTASPATEELIKQLHACFPDMPMDEFKPRLRLAVGVFLGGVGEWCALQQVSTCGYAAQPTFWTDVLEMATALLRAPRAGSTGFDVRVLRPASAAGKGSKVRRLAADRE